MRRVLVLGAASLGLVLAQACSGDDSNSSDGGSDGAVDATQDATKQDGSSNDGAQEASPGDAGDGSCPAAWTATPTVDPTIEVPDGGGTVKEHGAATGTQDYTCVASTNDAGATTYAWTFVGPEATLVDCSQNVFAHDAGSPEWQGTDQSFVIGKKIAAFTPDGGAGSIPWLILQAQSTSGSGLVGTTTYVQRLNTDGGNAPSTTCDGNNVGTTSKAPYSADYYFYGN
ncbi:MAG TPA: DUF3455 domain-containing protein [Polyangiaceae bacterium]|jgi:hypothetical protein